MYVLLKNTSFFHALQKNMAMYIYTYFKISMFYTHTSYSIKLKKKKNTYGLMSTCSKSANCVYLLFILTVLI